MIAFPNIQNLDFVHAQVHRANYWTVSFYFPAVVNNGIFDLLLLVGAKEVHCISVISFAGDCRAQIFEAPTVNANGTPLSCVNHHRDGALASLTTAFHTPTIGATGTLLLNRYTPGAGGAGAGAVLRAGAEWNLAPNVAYLFRGTNVSGTAGDGESVIEFYEVEE